MRGCPVDVFGGLIICLRFREEDLSVEGKAPMSCHLESSRSVRWGPRWDKLAMTILALSGIFVGRLPL